MKRNVLNISLLLILTAGCRISSAQADLKLPVQFDYFSMIKSEQKRIDLIDGKVDSSVHLFSKDQTHRATKLFFTQVNSILTGISIIGTPKERDYYQKCLFEKLRNIDQRNYHFLTYWENNFKLISFLFDSNSEGRQVEYLQNNILNALDCIPFYVNRSYALDFFTYATRFNPYDVLTHYDEYRSIKGSVKILESSARQDPNAVRQYFGSQHNIMYALNQSRDSVVLELLDIYKKYGNRGKSYTNIHFIHNKKLTIEQSEEIARDPDIYLPMLIKIRREANILGSYAVDQEIGHICLKPVMRVNELHDEKLEATRFAVVKNSSAEELYTMIVYTREEIFTSSFLGLYKRMMARRPDSSGYVFLKRMGMNRFRTFISLCAGYNVLQKYMNTMTAAEKSELVNNLVKGVAQTGGDLSAAVELTDIYGSLSDSVLKVQLRESIKRELITSYLAGDKYSTRVYGFLYKLCDGNPTDIIGNMYAFDLPALDKVDQSQLFPDGKNVQQHLFYDDKDEDGLLNSYLNLYRNVNWLIKDKGSYVLIESKTGGKIFIYCNKPSRKDQGFKDVEAVFEKQKRWPDVTVHRSHSYYVDNTIESLTNNVKVAILGSCGGYKNISHVLDRATDAQIISSKQIGTTSVNNVLIRDFTEMVRTTKAIDWRKLWKQLDVKLKTNPLWPDYVPPYKNLGARFVKAFLAVE